MNIYNFDVNFTTGRIYAPDFILVVNDHNSTLFKFTFDQIGRYVFKLLYPDGTVYVHDIADNQLKLTKGVLNQEGNYKFEISLYGDDNRLTTARIKEFPVRLELVSTDEPVQADDRLPILDNLIEETNKVVEAAKNGDFDGATFTPSVSDTGDLSWTNDKGKENPPTVNIKGEKGDPGAVKMQVVDTLPDVGETDTIYLVKKNNPGEQNLYDEYVYTETSGWEHIGDTSVDLTDYYTKVETDERLNNKQDTLTAGDNITIENNVISASGGKSELYTFYTGIDYNFNRPDNIYQSALSTDKRNILDTMLCNIITDAMTTDNKAKMLLLTFNNSNQIQGLPYILFTFGDNQKLDTSRTTYRMVSIPNGIYDQILSTYNIAINGSWENNVFSVSNWIITKSKQITVLSTDTGLSKTNTKPYTPTNDYNPATKKYVDDNKTPEDWLVLETSRSFLGTTGKLELTDVDSQTVLNFINSNDFQKPIMLKTNTGGTGTHPIYLLTPYNVVSSSKTYKYVGYDFQETSDGQYKQYILSIENLVGEQGSYTFGRIYITISIVANLYKTSSYLLRNNSSVYTPTGDYNPATKKYVDDSVSGKQDSGPIFFIDIPSQTLNSANRYTQYDLPSDFNEGLTSSLQKALTKYNTFSVQFFIKNILTTFYPSENINYTPLLKNKPNKITLYGEMHDNGYPLGSGSDTPTYTAPIPLTLEISLSWSEDVPTVTAGKYGMYTYSRSVPSINWVKENTLTKTNTTRFAPTSDYHPSTKLYTDKTHYENMVGYDATKTQVLKNVNGTLTWVDEV